MRVLQFGNQSFHCDGPKICGLKEFALRDSAPDALLIAGRLPAGGLEGLGGAPADFPVGITQRVYQGSHGQPVLASAERLNDRLANLKVRVCEHRRKEFHRLLPLPCSKLLDRFEPDSRYSASESLLRPPVHHAGRRGRRAFHLVLVLSPSRYAGTARGH